MIVDAHCHISSRWYQPVESLLFEMDRHGVERAVLIQMIGSYDNSDMIAACRQHHDRFSFVAALAEASPAEVDRALDAGARGLRLRSTATSAGDDPLEIWRIAERHGLGISCLGTAASFVDGAIAGIAEQCPKLALILEHLGGLARPDVGDRAAATGPMLALARFPNLSVKLPGLGQLAPRLHQIDRTRIPLDLDAVPALLEDVLAHFGSDRILWGSDYPPVAAREGYGHALNWTRDLIAARAGADSAAIFGGNAMRHFFSGAA